MEFKINMDRYVKFENVLNQCLASTRQCLADTTHTDKLC